MGNVVRLNRDNDGERINRGDSLVNIAATVVNSQELPAEVVSKEDLAEHRQEILNEITAMLMRES